MEKHQEASQATAYTSGASCSGGDVAGTSSNLYPAPPSYDQATGAMPMAPPPEQMPMPMPASMPMPMPMPMPPVPPHMQQPKIVYATRTQAGPVIHVQAQQQPVVIVQQPFGPEPIFLACPFCHAENMTRVDNEPNSCTHLTALLLCVLGFWCCACVPYCVNSCMSANHYCRNCYKFLGTFNSAV